MIETVSVQYAMFEQQSVADQVSVMTWPQRLPLVSELTSDTSGAIGPQHTSNA